jgi:hypothetical protein
MQHITLTLDISQANLLKAIGPKELDKFNTYMDLVEDAKQPLNLAQFMCKVLASEVELKAEIWYVDCS